MKEYLDVLRQILHEGVEKESGRANMPNTIGISKADIKMDLRKGFPLLTTKKMYWRGIVHELLWFLRGETNIKYLVDNNVNIWNSDAYRWYLKKCEELLYTKEVFYKNIDDFVNAIKRLDNSYYNDDNNIDDIQSFEEQRHLSDLISWNYYLGNLGKVYGYQWRNQNGVDQVKDVVDGLKNNPYSRYHIIDGWNKADFRDMALPPCHLLYQFIVTPMDSYEREDYYAKMHNFTQEQRDEMNPNATDDDVHKIMDEENIPKFHLDLNMYQRSCDTFLGVPFNIASMSLLLTIIAKVSNMSPRIANWIGGDTHLYVDHIDAVLEQTSRKPLELCQIKIDKDLNSLEDICSLTIDDFKLINYKSHDKIKAELFTGVKK